MTSLAVIYFLVLVLDPYDSGRMTNFAVSGVVDENPRTANASRGRDPNFNSVVIGNSRGQLVDPKRLSDATGLSFVQLTVPGVGAQEQLTLLRWFIQHHRQIGAVLLVADPVWCTQKLGPPASPFPFWLYSESPCEYSLNILDTKALDLAWRRTLLWLDCEEVVPTAIGIMKPVGRGPSSQRPRTISLLRQRKRPVQKSRFRR